MNAEAHHPERHQRKQRHDRAQRRPHALPRRSSGQHQERQQQSGRQLHAHSCGQRRHAPAYTGAGSRGRRQRQRGHQHHQRVVVRAADRHHEQHWVQPHERGSPATVVSKPAGSACDQRDRCQAGAGRQRLERPQPCGDRERSGEVAGEREQRPVGRVLKGPAHVPVDGIARRFGREVGVGVEPVQRAHAREGEIAEHVLGDQRRSEHQDQVRSHDRAHQRPGWKRSPTQQDQGIAGAHQEHQRLEARTPQSAAQVAQRPCQPHRPAAFPRRHVLRRFGGRIGAQQRHRHEHPQQPQHDSCRAYEPLRRRSSGRVGPARPVAMRPRAGSRSDGLH